MRRIGCAVALLMLLVSPAMAETVLPGLVRETLVVPIDLPDGRHVKLEGLVIRPDHPGQFPLVILVHGSPRSDPKKFLDVYRELSPTVLERATLAFAQHGYAAVSVLRRGFGRSDGPYAELAGDSCDDMNYLKVGRISAEDVIGAVAALRGEPWADPGRVLLLGYSTGGLAVTSAGALNPAGVVGVINFAGGRGAFRPDEVCSPDRLVEAFAASGVTARSPSLWIFAANDHFFGVPLAERMFDAYTKGGAPAQLRLLPPYGSDGHLLLETGPIDLWWPTVVAFLASQNLPTELVVDLPPMPSLTVPQLNTLCSSFFSDYLAARTDAKAFAINPEGHCGFSIAGRTADEAKAQAMKYCSSRWIDCSLYAVGHRLVRG
jgi:dienelactone hydrolase